MPAIDVGASSASLASVRPCAERTSIASGEGFAGGGLSRCSPGAESVGDDGGGTVGEGGLGGVAVDSVGAGVGFVSVGDGSEVGHGSVGEGVGVGLGSVGVGVGLGSVGEGVGVGLDWVGEGVGVGLGSVGEGSVEGGGLSVGPQVSVGGGAVSVGVGSICAIARPPSADPNRTGPSTARTQARRLRVVGRRRAAVTRPRYC